MVQFAYFDIYNSKVWFNSSKTFIYLSLVEKLVTYSALIPPISSNPSIQNWVYVEGASALTSTTERTISAILSPEGPQIYQKDFSDMHIKDTLPPNV